jgi:hypothetical protein
MQSNDNEDVLDMNFECMKNIEEELKKSKLNFFYAFFSWQTVTHWI